MRRRKWRRLINRYGLKSAFRSTKVKLDYRDPTLGGRSGGSGEGKMTLFIIGMILVIVVFIQR
ncbi:hypothetical protein [Kordiimonas aestuarii]|uniref:hypothetical protein n=1 Tax=Kordiimonas aestuarii TaxID=1005925 RepID=UPI0021D2DC03|nr:hypothetical protein [Kordiimonas aestuarii]